jgi:hypothetical protein
VTQQVADQIAEKVMELLTNAAKNPGDTILTKLEKRLTKP